MKEERILGIIPVRWRFELTRFRCIRYLLKSRWIPFAFILLNASLLTAILYSSFKGGFSAGNYNFGVTMTWILWWVLLMTVMVPFFSRLWCSVCPFPLIGEWLQRGRLITVRKGNRPFFGLGRRWPKRLKNMWLMNMVFISVTFLAGLFTVRPFETFLILGLILLIATTSMLIWQRRSFCLYICPVSGFQGLYSNLSIIEIRRKDPEVCSNHRVKTCFTGNEDGHGCPWLIRPYKIVDNTNCGMCMECFKTCPYDNMSLNLRPPGVDLLDKDMGLDETWKAFIMIGVFITFYLVFQSPYGLLKDWLRGEPVSGYFMLIFFHCVNALVLLPFFHLIVSYLSKVLSGEKDISLKRIYTKTSIMLIPVGSAAWVAFSLGIIMPNGSYVLRVLSDPFGLGWNLIGTSDMTWRPCLSGLLHPLQAVTILAGLILSLDLGYRISQRIFSSGESAIRGFLPFVIYQSLITLLFLFLFIG